MTNWDGLAKSDTHASTSQNRLEGLARSVVKWGGHDVEVSLWSNELTIQRLFDDTRALCTISLLPHEPTFQVSLDLPGPSIREIFFNIGADDAGPAATMKFNDADDAARWLLEHLETSRIGSGCGSPCATGTGASRWARGPHRAAAARWNENQKKKE